MSEPVVIKVGGSLLAVPGALNEVSRWFDATRVEGQTRLVIAGGGGAVDALRAIDAANPLSAESAHWAAIQFMDTHTQLLPRWMPRLEVADRLPDLTEAGQDIAFACEPFLRETEPTWPGTRLAIGWESTSDAIAARLAEIVGGRLLLLKHTVEASIDSLAAASRAGLIDARTPRHAASLRGFTLLGAVRPGLP